MQEEPAIVTHIVLLDTSAAMEPTLRALCEFLSSEASNSSRVAIVPTVKPATPVSTFLAGIAHAPGGPADHGSGVQQLCMLSEGQPPAGAADAVTDNAGIEVWPHAAGCIVQWHAC